MRQSIPPRCHGPALLLTPMSLRTLRAQSQLYPQPTHPQILTAQMGQAGQAIVPSLGVGQAEAAGLAQPEAAALREEGVGAHTCQSSPELLGNFVSLD